jgi:hypothetical protein
MGKFEDKAARTLANHRLVREAVERGNGAEAKRLADAFRIPNALRLDLGVEMSTDPSLNKPIDHMGTV